MFGIHKSQQTHKDCHSDGCSGREGAKAYLRDALVLSKDKHLNVRFGTCAAAKRRRKKCYWKCQWWWSSFHGFPTAGGSTMGDDIKWNLQDDVLTGLVSKNESNGQLNLHFFSTLVTSWTLLTCYLDKALQSSSHKTSSRGSSRPKDRGITKTRRRPSKWVFVSALCS